MLVKLLKEHLPLKIIGRKLDQSLLWEILCHASTQQGYIEGSCSSLKAAPSGNTYRARLIEALSQSEAGLTELENRLNSALHGQLPGSVLNDLRRRSWTAAGDWVEIPYHGQIAEGSLEVRGGKPKSGTSRFHTYATLALIHKHKRVTIALTIVRKGETMIEVVRRLLDRARCLKIRFKYICWDKAFGSIAVLRHLRSRRIPYIIALAQRGKGGLKRLLTGRRSFQTRYRFKSGAAGTYTTDVVVACKYSRRRFKKPGVRYFTYAVYGLGRMKPLAISQAYRRRFSIESGYRQLHQVRARTTSTNHALRLLLIGIGLLIINLYVLLRRHCRMETQYGSRQRQVWISLDQLASDLRRYIELTLGLNVVSMPRAGPLF